MGILSRWGSGSKRRPGANYLTRPRRARFEPLERRQMLSCSPITVNMTDYGTDDFTVKLDGADLVVLAGTTEAARCTDPGSLTAVTLNGTSAAETVTVKDLGTDFDGQLTINGSTGTDTLSVDDSTGVDAAVADARTAEFTMTTHGATGYSVAGNDFEVVHMYSKNGGRDEASLRGTNDDDYGKSRPEDDLAWLYDDVGNSTDFYYRAKFFDYVHLYGHDGDDTMDMRDTSGNDEVRLDAAGDYTKLWWYDPDARTTNFVRAKMFEEINLNFTYDGLDDNIEYKGISGNDDVCAGPTQVEIFAGGISSPDIYYNVTSLMSDADFFFWGSGGTNRSDEDSPVYDTTYYNTWTFTGFCP